MKLSTGFKILGVSLVALAAEALLAYMVYSNYAFSLAETGRYAVREAYTTGPMASVAKIFYGVFGVTIAIGLGAPVVALISRIVRDRSDTPPSRHDDPAS